MKASRSKSPNLWLGITRELWLTAIVLVICITSGEVILLYHESDYRSRCAALLWALACLGASSVVGIVFGIPKAIAQPVHADDSGQRRSDHLQANTNMEQISDWLTKLLVGAGLVELKSIPHLLHSAASFAAGGLSGQPAEATAFATALIVYFSAEGFIGGYLATRMFFQIAFRHSDELLSEERHDGTPVLQE